MKKLTGVLMLTLMPMSAWAQRAGEFYPNDYAPAPDGPMSLFSILFLVVYLGGIWFFVFGPGHQWASEHPWSSLMIFLFGPFGAMYLIVWLV